MKFQILALLVFLTIQAKADLVVFTDRPQTRFTKAAEIFKSQTGENIKFVEAQYPELSTKLQDADVIMVKDLVLLADLKAKKKLQSFPGEFKNISPSMKDPENQWTALTLRVRTLVYNPNNVQQNEVESYADLAKPEWKGRLCLRTSKADYNVALTGGLMLTYGKDKARNMLSSWVGNLAEGIFANDTDLIEAIADGGCDVGIVNHYYLAQLLSKKPNLPVKIKFLNQNEAGVLTNGSSIGLVKTSQKKELAQKFADILLSEDIQLSISAAHFEYPAVQELAPSTLIKEWGPYKISPLNWNNVGAQAAEAKAMMSKAKYE